MKTDNWKKTVKKETHLWIIISAWVCISVFAPISAAFDLTIFKVGNNLQRDDEITCLFFQISLYFSSFSKLHKIRWKYFYNHKNLILKMDSALGSGEEEYPPSAGVALCGHKKHYRIIPIYWKVLLLIMGDQMGYIW